MSIESGHERLLVKLVKAADQGKSQELEGLLKETKAANILDDNTLRISLQKASEKGREPVVRLLLAEGAKTDIITSKGLPPLYRAVEKNHIKIVDLLLEHGADTESIERYHGRTACMAAAWRNHVRILETLLEHGAKVNVRDSLGRTVLHNLAADKVCLWGDEVIHLLLATDLDVNIEDDQGRTPLHWAAVMGKLRLVELLLELPESRKPNFQAANARGKTPLHLAAESGYLEITELLLNHGANPMATSDGGWTPLHNAAMKGFAGVVEVMLNHGAEVNAVTSTGMTPLHWAAQSGKIDAVKVLLADDSCYPNPRDKFDSTPLLLAAQYRQQEVVRHLSRFVFKPPFSTDELGALDGFQATIIDFGVGPKGTIVTKRSVYDTIYAEDRKNTSQSEDSEKYLVSTVTGNISGKPRFRWIHLPANNMRWAEALLTKHFLETGAKDVEGFKALERSLAHSHRGPKVHARFMRPSCQQFEIHGPLEQKDGSESSRAETTSPAPKVTNVAPTQKPKGQDKSGTSSPKPKPKPKEPTRRKSNIVLFMPFLHFETDERRNKMSRAIKDAISSNRDRPRKPAATYDEMLIRAHIHSTTQLHVRRTLDQFFYHGIDTDRRDRDQVVYRYCKEQNQEPKVFMVDQLWLWILGNGLIVTSFPQRWQQPRNDPLNVLDGIIEDIHARAKTPVRSVYELASRITGRCCGFFDRHRINDPNFQFLDMFESSIGRVTDQETALFRKYKKASGAAAKWLKIKRSPSQFPRSYRASVAGTAFDVYDEDSDNDSSNDSDEGDSVPEASDSLFNDNLLDIGREAGLLAECKDIRDELHIIHLVLSQQSALLREDIPTTICDDDSPSDHHHYNNRRSGGPGSELRRRFRDQQRLVELHIKDIERMDRQAEEIYQHLLRLLDLKQKSANAFEARFARDQAADTARQGQTIMVFTLVTIIFLPMSFIATFFSINFREFQQGSGGSPGLRLGFVSKFIFGIGLAVSIPLIFVAFIVDHIGRAMRDAQRRISRLVGHSNESETATNEVEIRSTSVTSAIYALGRKSADFTTSEKGSLDVNMNGKGFLAAPVGGMLSNEETGRSRKGSSNRPRISFQKDLERGVGLG
ncbi:MAG: hypothetical protein Q9227_004947 [Pyrenula ochraceoflavens]